MSPIPTSFSAPAPSMITRQSVCDATENASRDGMLALMTPVMTSTDGRWVAMHQVDTNGPGHLGDADDGLLDLAAGHHHQVVELVDDHDQVGEAIEAFLGQQARIKFLPIADDVAHLGIGQEVVATIHLAHRPLQGLGRLLGVGDHPGEQVGNPVVLPSSTRLGSTMIRRTSSGVVRIRIERDDGVDAR